MLNYTLKPNFEYQVTQALLVLEASAVTLTQTVILSCSF